MVEGTPLLREHTPKGYRKFESSRLRQMHEKAPDFRGFFFCGFGFLSAQSDHNLLLIITLWQKVITTAQL